MIHQLQSPSFIYLHWAAEKGLATLRALFFAWPTSSPNSFSLLPMEPWFSFSLDLTFWARLLPFSFLCTISRSTTLVPALVATVISETCEMLTILLLNTSLLHSYSTFRVFSFLITICRSFSFDFAYFREFVDGIVRYWSFVRFNSVSAWSELVEHFVAFSSDDCLLRCDLVPTLGLPLATLSSSFLLS